MTPGLKELPENELSEQEVNSCWRPQPGPQTDAIQARAIANELFYGGAKYGGKTDFLLGDFGVDVDRYGSNWRGVLFRKSYPELEEVMVRAHEIYPAAFPGAEFNSGSKTWKFPSGAWLRMRSLEREQDADKFQGHSYTWIGWDELPMWPTPNAYLRLISCLRLGRADVPTKRIRSTGNPGGVGHKWVKDRFITPNKTGYKKFYDAKTKLTKMFIPSRVADNQIGLSNDPDYVSRLHATAGVSAALVEAWLNGDWDVVAGAYFDVWGDHLVVPHGKMMSMISPWSARWIGGDWGFKHNSAFYWFAQEGEFTLCYDELVVNGQSCPDLAEQIARHSEGQKIDEFHLSHDAFAKRTDEDTVAEQLGNELAKWSLPAPSRASMDRIGGAQLLYQKFKAKLCLVSDKCVELRNTIPAIVHDPDKQEQTLKMEGDDPYDGYRYGVYGRLGPKPKPLEEIMREHVTSTDPTERAIQVSLQQERFAKTQQMGVQGFTRRALRRPFQ